MKSHNLIQRLTIPLLSIGIGAGLFGCTKQTYEYQIEYKKVKYTERTFLLYPSFSMNIIKGDTTYSLYDWGSLRSAPRSIDWTSKTRPDIWSDKLDRIDIDVKEQNIGRYSSKDIHTRTIQGEHTGRMFEKFNHLYNDLRAKIREMLRQDYENKHRGLEGNL